jgi:superfamily II DNA or RNA helicase
MKTEFNPGVLVSMHGREWVVLPSPQENVLLLKPLGGTDGEIKGVVLNGPDKDKVSKAEFPMPTPNDLGDFASARLLYEAARLSFRSGAGPFRSMGRLAFQPRAYQLVPLIMALRLPVVRLLIADDVGIGKTIEALMIARELLDRGIIKRFAVVCLPHLCDQWAKELKDKFGIEAALIRSGNIKRLERELSPDQTIFEHFPFQVISIDYIKGDRKRELFLNHLPEMVIVDEAHTCSSPGSGSSSRSQRHRVVKAIANNPDQHLLLLTATPHSGKPEEFQSIIGLLRPEFENIDLTRANDKEKSTVAAHFVQRRRKNVEKWMDETTPFPEREPLERAYGLSPAYREVFYEVLKFARGLVVPQKEENHFRQRLRHYLAISLLRGVMSSPAMGATMLENRLNKVIQEQEESEGITREDIEEHPPQGVLDGDFDQDQAPTELVEQADFSSSEQNTIRVLSKKVASLSGFEHDYKAASALEVLSEWLHTDNIIVFCRYIQTANYLGELLSGALRNTFGKNLLIEVVTSELSDEERKARIDALGAEKHKGAKKLVIATDCMSEGINLQEQFSAVIHYDLPWNPNRLEQREGRVDRFGQSKEKVRTLLLFGEDNPMDGTVLKVLLRKARKIRQAIGISVPFPDDSKSIMDAVLSSVLLTPKKAPDESIQAQIDFGEDDVVKQQEAAVEKSFERIKEREKQITSVFAQNKIKPQELAPYLWETEEVLGNPTAVRKLLKAALPHFNTALEEYKKGWRISTVNLPKGLKALLPDSASVQVSFDSPTPGGYTYLGRNHAFVEALCLHLLDAAFIRDSRLKISRAAVFKSSSVNERTTMYLLRVRNVIANRKGRKELVAEELKLWGFRGNGNKMEELFDASSELYKLPTEELSTEQKQEELKLALSDYKELQKRLQQLASERADHMVDGHKKLGHALGSDDFKKVEPVLPPDVLGIYVILPTSKTFTA